MASPERIADPWGARTPYGCGERWPVREDAHLAAGASPERWVPAASLLHSHGDGIDIAVQDGRIVGVRGRPESRINRGRLGPKDMYGWQANHSADRLTRPLARRDGTLAETDWDTALDAMVQRSQDLLAGPGGGAFGLYTSGQLMLEEYYTLAVLGRAACAPITSTATRGCAPRRRRSRSSRRSPPTASRGRSPTSTTATCCSSSATTSRPRR